MADYANGYWLSKLAYGDYGSSFPGKKLWSEYLQDCVNLDIHSISLTQEDIETILRTVENPWRAKDNALELDFGRDLSIYRRRLELIHERHMAGEGFSSVLGDAADEFAENTKNLFIKYKFSDHHSISHEEARKFGDDMSANFSADSLKLYETYGAEKYKKMFHEEYSQYFKLVDNLGL